MNETQKRQILIKFPEIISLVDKIGRLGPADKDFYRDNILMTLLANTTQDDRAAMGTLTRLTHKFNCEIDKKENSKNTKGFGNRE